MNSAKSENTPRRKFTQVEDQVLKRMIEIHGPHRWDMIAKSIPGRTGRQCRDRYKNYLMSNLSNGPWTQEEDDLLFKKYQEFGSHWSIISKFFKGRSTNNLKNRWYTYHCKQIKFRENDTANHRISKKYQFENSDSSPLGEASAKDDIRSNNHAEIIVHPFQTQIQNLPNNAKLQEINDIHLVYSITNLIH